MLNSGVFGMLNGGGLDANTQASHFDGIHHQRNRNAVVRGIQNI